MEDLAKTHPIFLLKDNRAKEKETISQFEIIFDRFYHEGHLWIKRINGLVRLGIDDFTRQIIGSVREMRLPSINTVIDAGDTIIEISGNEKTLSMYAPLEGKVVDINPDILDNPSLAGMAPYESGWILAVEPQDMLQGLKTLLTGRSAKEWLKLESHKFHDLISKEAETDLPIDQPIPRDFAAGVSENTWKKIHETFFTQKKKKKKVKLYSVEDLH